MSTTLIWLIYFGSWFAFLLILRQMPERAQLIFACAVAIVALVGTVLVYTLL